jgi:hypothetical protein
VCVNLASDSNNCGSCAKVCSLVACTGGYCVQRLGVGWTTQHAGTAGFSTSYAFGEPVTFSATFTITALGVHNATAVTGNIVMGLYTDSGGLPYTLLAETAVSGMYQGNEELPLSYRVAPGKYWVVAQSSVTPPWGYGSPGTYFFSNVGAYSGTLPSPMPEPMPPTLSGTTNAGSIDFYLVGDQ